MFSLENQKVKLSSVNARAEIHGEQRKPAFDLKFEVECANDVLIHFHPELRQMLYKKSETPDLIEQIEGSGLTELRFSKMGAIKWSWEGDGYTVIVDYGLGGPSNIKLYDCKVDGFKFAPMDGGSLVMAFRVIAHPETNDVGRLCDLIQQNFEITVEPPGSDYDGNLIDTETRKRQHESREQLEKLFEPDEEDESGLEEEQEDDN